jgi:NAD-dependent deacetylase
MMASRSRVREFDRAVSRDRNIPTTDPMNRPNSAPTPIPTGPTNAPTHPPVTIASVTTPSNGESVRGNRNGVSSFEGARGGIASKRTITRGRSDFFERFCCDGDVRFIKEGYPTRTYNLKFPIGNFDIQICICHSIASEHVTSSSPHVARFDAFEPIAIDSQSRVFVLTGAGISAESGIATFRDANGLWEKFRIEDVASPEGWRRDPAVVWKFYSQRRAQAATCKPNAAHVALAELESKLDAGHFYLCTQNVDPLHERAGSSRVVHMHGELFRTRCESCSKIPFTDEQIYLKTIPRCDCGARLRPHICWFGEMPFDMDRIADALDRCTHFVTIGSSGAVYPAAGFVARVGERRNALSVYVGPEAPENGRAFDECRIGTATQVVPNLFAFR